MRNSKVFVTVDCVVFKKGSAGYELLLIKRKNNPFVNCWALPGGFVEENEDIDTAAKRELQEETGIVAANLEQLKAFGSPFRDPRQHTVSIAFLVFADANAQPVAADDACDAKWFSIEKIPELAFDHAEIINFALSKIQS